MITLKVMIMKILILIILISNNNVDYNNQRITRSIAKMIKENIEQVIDNRAKSKMHNINTINKQTKPTKLFSDKLIKMPKTCNCRKIYKDKCSLNGNCLI